MFSGWILMSPNHLSLAFYGKPSVWSDKTQRRTTKGAEGIQLNGIPQTKSQNKNKLRWRATWLSLRAGARSEDTGADNGRSVLGLMACSFTTFYCLVTQRQQMCLHSLYYLSLTSCQHVCVETIEGLPQRHMCSGVVTRRWLDWSEQIQLWKML